MTRRLVLLTAVLAVVSGGNTLADDDVAANATRPSVSDNAYLSAPGYVEIETGFFGLENAWSIPTLLKLSVSSQVEFGFAMTGIVNHVSGGETETGAPGAQIKVQLTDQSWGALAIAGRVDWPKASSAVYTAYPVVSIQTSPLQIDVTLGGVFANLAGTGYEGSLLYAVSVAPKLDSEWGVYGEIFGLASSSPGSVAIDAGISYGITPRLILDAAVNVGLSDNTDTWGVQIGFTYTMFKVL